MVDGLRVMAQTESFYVTKRMRSDNGLSDSGTDEVKPPLTMTQDGDLFQPVSLKGFLTMQKIGLSKNEIEKYSFLKIINSRATGKPLDGVEVEASQTISDMLRKMPNGTYVPADVLYHRTSTDYYKGSPTAGGDLIQTTLLASSFIEVLLNSMQTMKLGVQVIDDLLGDIQIPKQTSRQNATWIVENADSSEAVATFAQVGLSPKTLTCSSSFSRKLLLQSSLAIEQFVRMDLARSIALGIDYAIIAGDSGTGSPEGIIGTSYVNNVENGTDGGALTFAKCVEFISDVAACNALVGDRQGFLTNSSVAAALMLTPKIAASTFPIFCWEGSITDGTIAGYKAVSSNQVPSTLSKGGSNGILSAMLFGCWDQVFVGQWGGLDLLVDPFTLGSQGATIVRTFQDLDICLRHAQSFSVSVDIKTS